MQEILQLSLIIMLTVGSIFNMHVHAPGILSYSQRCYICLVLALSVVTSIATVLVSSIHYSGSSLFYDIAHERCHKTSICANFSDKGLIVLLIQLLKSPH